MAFFRSFVQAGFECSTHRNRHGKRVDVVGSSQHDRFALEDYRRVREMGITTVREGARWHVIESRPGRYAFASLEKIYDAAAETGAEIVLDLLHFGWPDHLDVFRGEFVTAFEEFTAATVEFLRSRRLERAFIIPVNEISFLSWAAGDEGVIYPHMRGMGGLLKRQLVRAAITASKLIRRRLRDSAILCSAEPAIHIHGDAEAERHRQSMFEAWDMLTGRVCPELGGKPEYIQLFGLNYYDRNQWVHKSECVPYTDVRYRPFRDILKEVHERYRTPVWVSETGAEGDLRTPWFEYIASEVQAAVAGGLPVQGLCLYPIVNHPGWDDDRHCHNGLWDYADETGYRESFLALARAIENTSPVLSSCTNAIRTGG